MPGLALPFAAMGLAAGLLAPGLLTILLTDVVPSRNQFMAPLIAALMGVTIGAVFSRKMAASTHVGIARLTMLLTALVVAGGLVTGVTVSAQYVDLPSIPWWARAYYGAIHGGGAIRGGLSALAFVPICALVLAAARRARRARHGSLVASADRRTLWTVPATTLAVSSVATIPFVHDHEVILFHQFGLLIAVTVGLVLVAFLFTDAFALFRVARAAGLEERNPAEARDVGAVPSFDLGLGDDVRALVGRAAYSCRSRVGPTALVLGSVTAARAALVRALLHSAIGLAITAAALAGHRWAETPAALLAFLEPRCERSRALCGRKIDIDGGCMSSSKACYDAGVLLLSSAVPVSCSPPPEFDRPLPQDVQRGEALLRTGSEAGDRCSCEALERSYRSRSSGEAKPPLPHGCFPYM